MSTRTAQQKTAALVELDSQPGHPSFFLRHGQQL